VNKERRLGRGLEALLGQLPSRNEPAQSPQQNTPAASSTPSPAVAAPSTPATPPAPSAEALFRLDVPHAAPGQFSAQPHRPPVRATQAATAVATLAEEQHEQESVESASPPIAFPARINVHQIDRNPAQPRQDFDPDEMQSLSESISTHGLLQPVVVRRTHDRYQLIAGERRLRAAIKAGWVDVPVNVIEADERQMAELAVVENLHRKDLNALEKAASFQKYLDQYGCTQEELASRLKLDRSTIANLIRLLELPEAVKNALTHGKITQGHARALLPLGDEHEQIQFCQRIQREGLNVRQTEGLVQETIDAADGEPTATTAVKPARPARVKNEHLAALEQQFRTALGMKVKISHNARGRGKLVVLFRNHEEFERLKKHVCGS
jgi:ParB family transcriptional regulator, chromosome partitioning protein